MSGGEAEVTPRSHEPRGHQTRSGALVNVEILRPPIVKSALIHDVYSTQSIWRNVKHGLYEIIVLLMGRYFEATIPFCLFVPQTCDNLFVTMMSGRNR